MARRRRVARAATHFCRRGDDPDLDGQRYMQVGTIKDADGNDVPVMADLWQSVPLCRWPN